MILINFILAYLIGCIPTGRILAKLYNVDITTKGSGNVGATNVSRVLGKKAGVLILILDALKGIIGSSIYMFTSPSLIHDSQAIIFGFGAILGHCRPLPFMKGGKGVATSLGVILSCAPVAMAFVAISTFGLVFPRSRIVSLSSISSGISVMIYSVIFLPTNIAIIWWLIAILVISRHSDNIRRLIRGEESRI